MMLLWYVGAAILFFAGIVAGRLNAGPRRSFKGPFMHYVCGAEFAVPIVLLAGVPCVMANIGIGIHRVYVVSGTSECNLYWAVGSPSYSFAAGPPEKTEGNCIVNDSDVPRALENVVYSAIGVPDDMGAGDLRYIEPRSVEPFPGMMIHYFFDDVPPEKVSLKSKYGTASQWWLRNARTDEIQVAEAKQVANTKAFYDRIQGQFDTSAATWPTASDSKLPLPSREPLPKAPTSDFNSRGMPSYGTVISPSGAPQKHGFKFGQGRKDLLTNEDLLGKMPPTFSNSPGFDPYPNTLPIEKVWEIEDQVNQDMQNIEQRNRFREERGY